VVGLISPVLLIVIVLLSIWILWRKSVAGIPLLVGLIIIYATLLIATAGSPPTLGQLLWAVFLLGLSIGLLAWGIVNYITEELEDRPLEVVKGTGEGGYVVAFKPAGATYGVILGSAPWDERGARLFAEFLNEVVWVRGYKVEFMDAELDIRAGQPWVMVWGIVRPKTIIDRILY